MHPSRRSLRDQPPASVEDFSPDDVSSHDVSLDDVSPDDVRHLRDRLHHSHDQASSVHRLPAQQANLPQAAPQLDQGHRSVARLRDVVYAASLGLVADGTQDLYPVGTGHVEEAAGSLAGSTEDSPRSVLTSQVPQEARARSRWAVGPRAALAAGLAAVAIAAIAIAVNHVSSAASVQALATRADDPQVSSIIVAQQGSRDGQGIAPGNGDADLEHTLAEVSTIGAPGLDTQEFGTAEAGAPPLGAGHTDTTSVLLYTVHVIGEVETPGVVQLPPGSRVADAIWAAGGPSQQADLGAINLARQVTDGEQILIPYPGQVIPQQVPSAQAPDRAGDTGGIDVLAPGSAAGLGVAAGANLLVNINTADAGTLQQLPGIGPALAARIIAWRELNGYFRTLADLRQVSGIGPSKYEALADLVTVG